MSVLFLVLPLALCIVGGAVWGFLWAVRRGQFDDLKTPGVRMLHDDDPVAQGVKPADPPHPSAHPGPESPPSDR